MARHMHVLPAHMAPVTTAAVMLSICTIHRAMAGMLPWLTTHAYPRPLSLHTGTSGFVVMLCTTLYHPAIEQPKRARICRLHAPAFEASQHNAAQHKLKEHSNHHDQGSHGYTPQTRTCCSVGASMQCVCTGCLLHTALLLRTA